MGKGKNNKNAQFCVLRASIDKDMKKFDDICRKYVLTLTWRLRPKTLQRYVADE